MGQRLIREFDPPEPDERLPHSGLIRAWLMAGGYDFFMRRVEALGLAQWRQELLARVSGEVLEIGAGTGGQSATLSADARFSGPDRTEPADASTAGAEAGRLRAARGAGRR